MTSILSFLVKPFLTKIDASEANCKKLRQQAFPIMHNEKKLDLFPFRKINF